MAESLEPVSLGFVLYTKGDLLGHLLAYGTLLPLFIVGGFVTHLFFRREIAVAWYFLGQALNEVLVNVLKDIIAEKRPVAPATEMFPMSFGMPSNHAQFLGYFSVYGMLYIHTRVHLQHQVWKGLTDLLLLASAGFVAYSRFYLHLHTLEQIWVGLAVGASFAVVWFVLGESVVSRSYPWLCRLRLAEYFYVKDSRSIQNVLQFEYQQWKRYRTTNTQFAEADHNAAAALTSSPTGRSWTTPSALSTSIGQARRRQHPSRGRSTELHKDQHHPSDPHRPMMLHHGDTRTDVAALERSMMMRMDLPGDPALSTGLGDAKGDWHGGAEPDNGDEGLVDAMQLDHPTQQADELQIAGSGAPGGVGLDVDPFALPHDSRSLDTKESQGAGNTNTADDPYTYTPSPWLSQLTAAMSLGGSNVRMNGHGNSAAGVSVGTDLGALHMRDDGDGVYDGIMPPCVEELD